MSFLFAFIWFALLSLGTFIMGESVFGGIFAILAVFFAILGKKKHRSVRRMNPKVSAVWGWAAADGLPLDLEDPEASKPLLEKTLTELRMNPKPKDALWAIVEDLLTIKHFRPQLCRALADHPNDMGVALLEALPLDAFDVETERLYVVEALLSKDGPGSDGENKRILALIELLADDEAPGLRAVALLAHRARLEHISSVEALPPRYPDPDLPKRKKRVIEAIEARYAGREAGALSLTIEADTGGISPSE